MSKLSPETFKALLALGVSFRSSGKCFGTEGGAVGDISTSALRFGSEDYPSVLEDLADPPKVLCARGDLLLAERQLRASIVVRVMHLLIDAKLPNSSQLIWRPAEPLSFLG